ncbi:MAG: lipopolysaccharide heptosyltransferase II [Planctomycetes bacterium]|nr:lipopolysaccharide heptosyltransferase II [Planctomycetota bacterium]
MDLSRILIIKPSSLGDVIQALPVAWALRELCPKSRIDWLVTPGCAGIVEGLPPLDHVVVFDRNRFGRMWRNPLTLCAFGWFIAKLRRPRYTTVIDLQGLFRSGFLAWASGAGCRLGLADSREGADRFYTRTIPLPTEEISSVDRYMQAAFHLGVPHDAPRRFDVTIPAKAEADAQRVLDEQGLNGRRYVVLVPGARWMTKRWPEERFAALANRLHEKLGLAAVLVGAPDDRDISERMRQLRGRHMIDLIGRTNLKALAAVLRRAECIVTNDTGPMHLASAMGRPIIAIFGPTNVNLTGPYGPGHVVLAERADCAPCYRRSCLWEGQRQELVCQRSISVDEVFECVRQLTAADSPSQEGGP